jgi:perosamine synthetase
MFNKEISFIKNLYGNKDFTPLHEPCFTGNEKKYILDTIDSTFVSSVGKYVDQFEELIKDYTGAKYAIAVVNGTAALHMGLILSGVTKDDLVITQALSFIATCNAISYVGAEPVFVDIDIKTLGLSLNSLRVFLENVELINDEPIHIPTGKRIGACVPMHTFGFPVEIDEIVALCSSYNIPVVEDAAESLGSTYKGKHTGTFGLIGTYSFNGNKTITCGGGGIIVTNDDKLGPLAKHLTTQAKVPHKWEYVHDHIGYNYRCPNLNAALACAQLEQLEQFLKNKRNTAQEYQTFFSQTDLIDYISEPNDSQSNYWLNAVLFKNKEDRDLFLKETNENGVMTRPVWALMHRLEMFKNCIHDSLKNSIEIESRLVNIPSSVRI